ncbi:hypothetical protein GCM10020254_08330 [Streptomyces goshikiensis]
MDSTTPPQRFWVFSRQIRDGRANWGVIRVVREPRPQVLQRQPAVGLVGDRLVHHPAADGGAAGLVDVDVALGSDQDLRPAGGVRHDRGEVRHRSARHEAGGLLAEQSGGPILKGVDGRVLAVHVVAEPRLPHRAEHGGGTAG